MKWFTRLRRPELWARYVSVIATLAAADLFILFVPTEGLMISAVLVKPKRWMATAFWVSIGSAIGAFALAWVFNRYGAWAMDSLAHDFVQSGLWTKAESTMAKHGALAVGVIAFSPIPLQPIVMVAGTLHTPLIEVFVFVWVARFLKFGIYGWLAMRMPHLLNRIWGLKKELKESEVNPPKAPTS